MSLSKIREAKYLTLKLPEAYGDYSAKCRRPSSGEARAFAMAQMEAYGDIQDDTDASPEATEKLTPAVVKKRVGQLAVMGTVQEREQEYLLGLLVILNGHAKSTVEFDAELADIRSDDVLDDIVAAIRTAVSDAEGGAAGQLPLLSAVPSSPPPKDSQDAEIPTE